MKRRVDLKPPATHLEPTYSVDEVAAHLGLSRRAIFSLLSIGRRHRGCHPIRGGLWPTFKPSHKIRRIPLSAIQRHKRHLSRVHGEETAA